MNRVAHRVLLSATLAALAFTPLAANASITTYSSHESSGDCTMIADFASYTNGHCDPSSHPFVNNIMSDIYANGGITYYSPSWLSCGTNCGHNFVDTFWAGSNFVGHPDPNLTASRMCYDTDPRDSSERAAAFYRPSSNGGGTAGGDERTTLAWNGSSWSIYRTSQDYVSGSDWNQVVDGLTCVSDATPQPTLSADTYTINQGDSANISWNDNYWSAYSQETALNGSCSANFPISQQYCYEDFECAGYDSNGYCYDSYDTGQQICNDYTSVSGTWNTGALNQTTTYSYTCSSANGSNTSSVTINVIPNTPPSASISASPSSIPAGSSSTLSWSCSNSSSAYISNYGSVDTSGSVSVSPNSDTTYGLTCYGPSGQATSYASVSVSQACSSAPNACGQTNSGNNSGGSCSASTPANPSYYGQSCTISSSPNACGKTNTAQGTYNCNAQCVGAQPSPPPNSTCQPAVSCSVSPTTATIGQSVTWSASASAGSGGGYSYTWSGTNLSGLTGSSVRTSYTSGGTYTGSVTVVDSQGQSSGAVACTASGSGGADVYVIPAPTVTVTASPSTILRGQSASLTWSSTNASSCTAVGGFSTGGAANNGSGVSTGALTSTSQYQIYCDGPSGRGYSNIATVTVLQPSAYITAVPARINAGESTNISWSAQNINGSCSVTGTDGYSSGTLAGPDIASTTVARTLTAPATYTLSCPSENVSSSIRIQINPSFNEF